jgi:hypothetical protein
MSTLDRGRDDRELVGMTILDYYSQTSLEHLEGGGVQCAQNSATPHLWVLARWPRRRTGDKHSTSRRRVPQ